MALEIYNQVFTKFPQLKGQEVLVSYRNVENRIKAFRLLFLSLNEGIVEIEVKFIQTVNN